MSYSSVPVPAASPPMSPPPPAPYDYLCKVLVIGDSGVGKSCLLLRFVDNTFTEQFISTIGVDFKLKTLAYQDKIVKLQIWDTAGQERFKSITASYYRGANGIMICYDVTDPDTFTAIQYWLNDSKRLAASNLPIVLVGTKVDLKKQRAVPYATAKEFADRAGIPYVECSAKSGYGVDKVFNVLVTLMLQKRNTKEPERTFVKPPRTKCCSY